MVKLLVKLKIQEIPKHLANSVLATLSNVLIRNLEKLFHDSQLDLFIKPKLKNASKNHILFTEE